MSTDSQFAHERVAIELRVREVQIDARLSVRRERLGVTDRTPQDPSSDLVNETVLRGKGNELIGQGIEGGGWREVEGERA